MYKFNFHHKQVYYYYYSRNLKELRDLKLLKVMYNCMFDGAATILMPLIEV